MRRASMAIDKNVSKGEGKLQLFVFFLFCVIVVGVSLVYHFYNLHDYRLEIADQLAFEEIERELRVKDAHGEQVLVGELGLNLPKGLIPRLCEEEDWSCVEWKDRARLTLRHRHHDDVDCFDMRWSTQDRDNFPYDCFELDDGRWFGGVLPTSDDFENLRFARKPFVTSSVNNVAEFGPVIEPTWMTSARASISVDPASPLHVELNANSQRRFCLVASFENSSYTDVNNDVLPTLNYSICTAATLKDLHKHLLSTYTHTNQVPPHSKFDDVIYSLWPTLKTDIDEASVRSYLQGIQDQQLPNGS